MLGMKVSTSYWCTSTNGKYRCTEYLVKWWKSGKKKSYFCYFFFFLSMCIKKYYLMITKCCDIKRQFRGARMLIIVFEKHWMTHVGWFMHFKKFSTQNNVSWSNKYLEVKVLAAVSTFTAWTDGFESSLFVI